MKKTLLTWLLAPASLTALAQQISPPTNPAECTEAFLQALLDENGPALRPLLTTDFALTSFGGSLMDGGSLAEAMSGGYVNTVKWRHCR